MHGGKVPRSSTSNFLGVNTQLLVQDNASFNFSVLHEGGSHAGVSMDSTLPLGSPDLRFPALPTTEMRHQEPRYALSWPKVEVAALQHCSMDHSRPSVLFQTVFAPSAVKWLLPHPDSSCQSSSSVCCLNLLQLIKPGHEPGGENDVCSVSSQ